MIVLLDNDNIAEIIDNKVTRVIIDLAGTCLLSSYNKEDCNALDTLHPWLYNMCDVVLQSLDDAVNYIKKNYLQI